jgi:hypothetical protein
MKLQSTCIIDETWDCELWLLWPAQNKEVDEFIKKRFAIKEQTRDGAFQGRFIEIYDSADEEWAGLIALRQWKGTPNDYAVLAHECLHAVRWFLDSRGIELKDETDETYAYFLGSLVRRCAERMNRGRRK